SGAVHRLNPGFVDVGKSQKAQIRVEDPSMPDYALRVSLDQQGVVHVAPYEGTTAALNREQLFGEAVWQPESQVVVGSTLLELGVYSPPDAALTPSEDGVSLDYNRPPRMLPPDRKTRFQLPKEPGDNNNRPFPLVMVLAPVFMSVVMALA